jgi:hypothetical protein
LTARPRGLKNGPLDVLNFSSGLEGMPALHDGDVFHQLVRLVGFLAGEPSRAANLGQPTDTERGQPSVAIHLGDPLNAELRRDAHRVRVGL